MGINRKGGSEKPGDVKYKAENAVPSGWLECNGAAVSRTAYAALFLAIGTAYGAGDGVNTFNVPDLRGEFIRGFDNGRGVDGGRVFGAAQADEIKSHSHTVPTGGAVGGSLTRAMRSNDSSPGTQGSNTAGGTETRPRNVAMLPCIKY